MMIESAFIEILFVESTHFFHCHYLIYREGVVHVGPLRQLVLSKRVRPERQPVKHLSSLRHTTTMITKKRFKMSRLLPMRKKSNEIPFK
jgi:hypothetical protein